MPNQQSHVCQPTGGWKESRTYKNHFLNQTIQYWWKLKCYFYCIHITYFKKNTNLSIKQNGKIQKKLQVFRSDANEPGMTRRPDYL